MTEFYKSCCVCRLIEYEGKLITESKLKDSVGERPYKLTHTYLSKYCLEQYINDMKHNKGYLSLSERCVETDTK